jgi:hypothetical protein
MKLNQYDLPKGCDYRGAQMGRVTTLPIDRSVPLKYAMIKLNLVDYDYDVKGSYWGHSPLNGDIYWAKSDEEIATKFTTDYSTGRVEHSQIFVRARNRKEAKERVREWVSNAKFYR